MLVSASVCVETVPRTAAWCVSSGLLMFALLRSACNTVNQESSVARMHLPNEAEPLGVVHALAPGRKHLIQRRMHLAPQPKRHLCDQLRPTWRPAMRRYPAQPYPLRGYARCPQSGILRLCALSCQRGVPGWTYSRSTACASPSTNMHEAQPSGLASMV